MSNIKYCQRKFYNKWLYKVTIDLQGGGIFRLYPLEKVIEFCIEPVVERSRWGTLKDASRNSKNILKVAMFFDKNKDKGFNKRIEGNSTDLYTNDKEFYKEMYEHFENMVIHAFEPMPGYEDKIADSQEIITTKLPHNKYLYKVYLAPHKLKGDLDKKIKFLDWITGQGDKIRMSEAVKKWFIKTDFNWDRRYVLVEDEKTLLLLKLRGSDALGRIYSYHLVDK